MTPQCTSTESCPRILLRTEISFFTENMMDNLKNEIEKFASESKELREEQIVLKNILTQLDKEL